MKSLQFTRSDRVGRALKSPITAVILALIGLGIGGAAVMMLMLAGIASEAPNWPDQSRGYFSFVAAGLIVCAVCVIAAMRIVAWPRVVWFVIMAISVLATIMVVGSWIYRDHLSSSWLTQLAADPFSSILVGPMRLVEAAAAIVLGVPLAAIIRVCCTEPLASSDPPAQRPTILR